MLQGRTTTGKNRFAYRRITLVHFFNLWPQIAAWAASALGESLGFGRQIWYMYLLNLYFFGMLVPAGSAVCTLPILAYHDYQGYIRKQVRYESEL